MLQRNVKVAKSIAKNFAKKIAKKICQTISKKDAKNTQSLGHLKNMLLQDIFEGGDKIGWFWPFVNIVQGLYKNSKYFCFPNSFR